MLSGKESFKVGFLSRCVEQGISNDEALQKVKEATDALDALEKQAGIYDVGKDVGGVISGITSPILNQALGLVKNVGLFGPPLLGAGAGYLHSKMTDVDEEDVDDIKQEELIDEYRRQAERLRQSKALRAYKKKKKKTTDIYL